MSLFASKARLRRWVAILAGTLGLLLLGLTAFQVQQRRYEVAETHRNCRLLARDAARQVAARFRQHEGVAAGLVAELESGRLRREGIEARLRTLLGEAPELFHLEVLYLPRPGQGRADLFGPALYRSKGQLHFFQREELHDYTTASWFQEGLGKTMWLEPNVGEKTGLYADKYCRPFREPGAQGRSGMVFLSLNLSEGIEAMISAITVGRTGYAFLVSRQGHYLVDPNKDHVLQHKTLDQVAEEQGDGGRCTIAASVRQGLPGYSEARSGVTGQRTWIFTEPMGGTGCSLGVTFIQSDLQGNQRSLRNNLTVITSLAVLFLICVAYLVLAGPRRTVQRLVLFAGVSSLLLSVGVGVTWYLILRLPDANGIHIIRVFDHPSVNLLLRAKGHAQVPPMVPVGLNLQTLVMDSANEVTVGGQCWERRPRGIAAGLRPDLAFPDATSIDFREASHSLEGDTELWVWRFRAVLRQNFDKTVNYPFDTARVRIRIHTLQGAPLALVPDFEAYPLRMASALPGLEPGLKVPGWKLMGSYFSMAEESGGNQAQIGKAALSAIPELRFNIELQRRFLDPFLSAVLPVLIISALLFALIMTITKDPAKLSATGFKAADHLKSTTALLFPGLIAQINLRSRITAAGLIYIEYLYFALYFVILLSATYSLVFVKSKSAFTEYGDNLMPKLLFWPILLVLFYAISLVAL